jgi:glucosamine--fructose-6-phosphate aminotransferase (isomerizing)
MSSEDGIAWCRNLAGIASQITRILATEQAIQAIAEKYYRNSDALYLGRGLNFPIALEGALKLKEISYIHAEGYAAGEMKHGPIALIDRQMPVVVLAPRDHLYGKMVTAVREVKARNGRVVAIVTEGDDIIGDLADDVYRIPDADPMFTPFLTTVPLQLLAYHIAVLRGTDVDQPRNLAKSVTVE